ncbi:MAG: protein kinase domain-containing protein [Persicimonas sp.]
MDDLIQEDLEAYWKTIADDSGEAFDSRQSRKHKTPKTLARHHASPLDTLMPLNPTVDGERRQNIDFLHTFAEGGMGELLVARQHPIGRNVAVKRLKTNKRSERHRRLLLEEGWITGRLQHPNIVPIYTLGHDDDDHPAIVMKLVEGATLAELLEDFDKLPEAFAAESQLESHIHILIQVCNALSYTHDQGFIHRDIKPSNIIVGQYGEVYLLDWGIAVQVGASQEDAAGGVSANRAAEGTPAYMAPEMAAPSFADLSWHTDIFLLGACLHKILTGEEINEGQNYFQVLRSAYVCEPPEYDFGVPEELARIATKAMARQPEDRYGSVVEFRKALRDFLDSQSSWRLAEVARSKLVGLQQKVAADEQVSRSELYPMFGACRMGFEQALEVRADNEEARQGLQRAVESMIEWELRNRGATNAETLLNSLPQPNPDLEERVEAALGRAAQRHRESLLTKMSPDAVLGVDHTGTIVYANEQTTEIFGWTREELQNRKIEVLIPQAKRSAHLAQRKAYQQHPTSRSMNSGLKLEGLHKDGSRVTVEISLAPVSVGGKQLTVASVRQKTPDAPADKPSTPQMSVELLDALSLAVFVIQNRRVLWANAAFEQMLGQDGDRRLTGRTLGDFFPDDASHFPDFDAVDSAQDLRLEEVRTRTLDGRELSLDLKFVRPSGQRFAGAILVEAQRA